MVSRIVKTRLLPALSAAASLITGTFGGGSAADELEEKRKRAKEIGGLLKREDDLFLESDDTNPKEPK